MRPYCLLARLMSRNSSAYGLLHYTGVSTNARTRKIRKKNPRKGKMVRGRKRSDPLPIATFLNEDTQLMRVGSRLLVVDGCVSEYRNNRVRFRLCLVLFTLAVDE